MEILFPHNIRCIFCDSPISRENDLSICRHCHRAMEYIEEICLTCGRAGSGSSLCTECADEHYGFDRVYSVLHYNDFIHTQIYRFKYGHQGYLGAYFGRILDRFMRINHIEPDIITSVPIARRRTAQRGYNQSALMAQEITRGTYIDVFRRVKETQFLSKLSRVQRRIELEHAFVIDSDALDSMLMNVYGEQVYRNEERSENAAAEKLGREEPEEKIKLLIVDDILTTGATASALARLAKEQIAHLDVTILTLCNARKDKKKK